MAVSAKRRLVLSKNTAKGDGWREMHAEDLRSLRAAERAEFYTSLYVDPEAVDSPLEEAGDEIAFMAMEYDKAFPPEPAVVHPFDVGNVVTLRRGEKEAEYVVVQVDDRVVMMNKKQEDSTNGS